MLEEMWQIHELQLTHLVEMGRRWALGLKVEGVVGDGWGFWLGWGILLSNRNKGERSQWQRGRCFAGVGRGPFQKDPEISGGTACGNKRCSCSAAANDLQIKVFVSIESFTRTNIHPKINFPFFLFLQLAYFLRV